MWVSGGFLLEEGVGGGCHGLGLSSCWFMTTSRLTKVVKPFLAGAPW